MIALILTWVESLVEMECTDVVDEAVAVQGVHCLNVIPITSIICLVP